MVVNATFAGASAEVIAQTVAAPIEQEINGVDNMLYVVSQSTGNGALSISVVFKPGTNIDQAQVLVQTRVAVALAAPARGGAAHRRDRAQEFPDLMLVIHLISPEGKLGSARHFELCHHKHQGCASLASTESATPSCSARATIRCGYGSIRPW